MQPTLSINYGKDFRQDYIELVANGPPGGYVFTMAADYEMMWRGALMHHFLTEQRVSVTDGIHFFTWVFTKTIC